MNHHSHHSGLSATEKQAQTHCCTGQSGMKSEIFARLEILERAEA